MSLLISSCEYQTKVFLKSVCTCINDFDMLSKLKKSVRTCRSVKKVFPIARINDCPDVIIKSAGWCLLVVFRWAHRGSTWGFLLL